jgi:hypothetical protein
MIPTVNQTSAPRTNAFIGLFANNRIGGSNTQNWTGSVPANFIGVAAQPRIAASATGTITNMTGVYTLIQNSSTNTVTNNYGMYIDDGSTAGTAIATAGIAIVNQDYASTAKNTNLLVGTGTIPTDQNWSINSQSTYDSLIKGNLRVGGTSAPTVALDVTGAALISTTLGVTGAVSANSTTDSSSITTGSLITAGGLGIAKTTYLGGDLIHKNTNGSATGCAIYNIGPMTATAISGYGADGGHQNGGTQTYAFGAGSNGILTVGEMTNGNVAQYIIPLNASTLVKIITSDDTKFSTTANTADKICVTVSGGTVTVRNNLASGSLNFRIHYLKLA